MPDSSPPSRFTWRRFFDRTTTAVFVFGGDRRLRYANPAWEVATGESFAKLRGTKVSARRSMSVFAPPPEVWAGKPATIRRAAADAAHGPPWWDFTFTPLMGDGDRRVLGVVGILTVVGAVKSLPRVKVPEAVGAVRAAHAGRYTFDLLNGPTAVTQRMVSQARAAAIGEMPVWIIGEPGSGKETLARVIHHHSPRRERAFVGLIGGGVQPYQIEGLLFGKGGLATGPHVGTLYLKHPADFPRPLQDRILTWCESAFGPRLISGATAPAAELVTSTGLAPLFDTRFSAFEIRVPPLRERLDDLPKLLTGLGEVTPDVLPMLRAYHWPGNVAELVEVVSAASGAVRSADHLPRIIRQRFLIASAPSPPRVPFPTLEELLESVERRAIQLALAKANGKPQQAAELLGIARPRLARRMDSLGIPTPPKAAKPGELGAPDGT